MVIQVRKTDLHKPATGKLLQTLGMFRQRTNLDPNQLNFYEQGGVVIKINPPCVQTA